MTPGVRGKLEFVPIDSIQPNSWNPNRMDAVMLEKERRSIELFGFVRAIVVREVKGALEIIDGFHRWTVLKGLGAESAPVRNLGKVSKTEAIAMGIAINEIRGRHDFFKLSNLFAGIEDFSAEEISAVSSCTADEIRAMVEAAGADWSEYNFKEPEIPDYSTIICRVPAEEKEAVGAQAKALCERFGIRHDRGAVELGLLFSFLLREADKQ